MNRIYLYLILSLSLGSVIAQGEKITVEQFDFVNLSIGRSGCENEKYDLTFDDHGVLNTVEVFNKVIPSKNILFILTHFEKYVFFKPYFFDNYFHNYNGTVEYEGFLILDKKHKKLYSFILKGESWLIKDGMPPLNRVQEVYQLDNDLSTVAKVSISNMDVGFKSVYFKDDDVAKERLYRGGEDICYSLSEEKFFDRLNLIFTENSLCDVFFATVEPSINDVEMEIWMRGIYYYK